MKKLFSLLLVVTFLLTSMTGCLVNNNPSESTTPNNTTPAETTTSNEATTGGTTCDTPHSYNEGVIAEDAILYTCDACGGTKTVEMPADFAFSLTWGFDGGYDSKTGLLKNGYNYQLGVDCETTLILTREELMNVYRLLYNANAFSIKEDFEAGELLGHPFYRVKFGYTLNGETVNFIIDGETFLEDYTDWEVHQAFGYAYYKIVDFIKSTEEYKALPPNTNAYE